jgi:hypothetical protein
MTDSVIEPTLDGVVKKIAKAQERDNRRRALLDLERAESVLRGVAPSASSRVTSLWVDLDAAKVHVSQRFA